MSDPTHNYSFHPYYNEQREKNLFVEEYYSSTDTHIYFNDKEQTQIGYINYELQEQLKPIYGYNSRTWDDVVIGSRIVTGTFKIPIQNKEKEFFDSGDIYDSAKGTYVPKQEENDTDKYNKEQQDNIYNTEWYGTTKRRILANRNSNINPDILASLIALYPNKLTVNSSYDEYRKAIAIFQISHFLKSTGEVNSITKKYIKYEVEKKKCVSINLDGATGYSDLLCSKGKTKLKGDGIILNTLNDIDKVLVYYVLDSQGKEYYISGVAHYGNRK